jgi:hypothetical protein
VFSVFTVIGKFICVPREFDYLILVVQVEGHRKQGKPRMRWLDCIKEATCLRLDDLRKQYEIGKNGVRWWKKKLGIEYGQMWSEFRRRQWQTTPVQLNLPRKSSVGSPGV